MSCAHQLPFRLVRAFSCQDVKPLLKLALARHIETEGLPKPVGADAGHQLHLDSSPFAHVKSEDEDIRQVLLKRASAGAARRRKSRVDRLPVVVSVKVAAQ